MVKWQGGNIHVAKMYTFDDFVARHSEQDIKAIFKNFKTAGYYTAMKRVVDDPHDYWQDHNDNTHSIINFCWPDVPRPVHLSYDLVLQFKIYFVNGWREYEKLHTLPPVD